MNESTRASRRAADSAVSLVPPEVGRVRAHQRDPVEWGRWLDDALVQNDIVYFSINLDDRLAGEIFLHDISEDGSDAMLGYHIFDPALRGRGTGRTALALLLGWVRSHPTIRRLFVTT